LFDYFVGVLWFMRVGRGPLRGLPLGYRGPTTPMGRLSATLERKKLLKSFGKRAGRFCSLTALAHAFGGLAPRRAIRLVSDQNRLGQMIQSKPELL
ncbi:MAG: hypothetical protein AAF724_18675, partial [Pseudomonadota bacterium]